MKLRDPKPPKQRKTQLRDQGDPEDDLAVLRTTMQADDLGRGKEPREAERNPSMWVFGRLYDTI